VIQGFVREAAMTSDLFWLGETQFSKIAPLLPTDTRGKPCVDDRRVIRGIVQVLRSRGRWIDAPAAYWPKKALYNRLSGGQKRACGPMCSTLSHKPAGRQLRS
jgi:transposase